MPITIKTGTLKYKKSDGTYNGFNAIAQESTDQQLADIHAAGTAEVGAVTAKGEEVLESIPEDYTELSGDVNELKSALDKGFYTSVVYSRNMLDKTTADSGMLKDDGTVGSSTSFYTSDFIPIGANTNYRVLRYNNGCIDTAARAIMYYDSAKAPLLGTRINDQIGNGTTVADTAYIRISFTKSYYDSIMLFIGNLSDSSQYIPYSAQDVQYLGNNVDLTGNIAVTPYLDDILGETTEAITLSNAQIGNFYVNEQNLITNSNVWIAYLLYPIYDKITVTYVSNGTHAIINFYSDTNISNDNYLGGIHGTRGTHAIKLLKSSIPAGTKCIIINSRDNPATDTAITVTYHNADKRLDHLDVDVKRLISAEKGEDMIARVYKNVPNGNDFAVIRDEIWFAENIYQDGVATDFTTVHRYKINDGYLAYISDIDTDFGHWNSVDYNEENDCLIFGNGANSVSTEGNYFVVVPHPLSLGAYARIADVGIKYDVDIGFKVQAVWGDPNLGRHNIVYLISNSCQKITKIFLTRDANGDFNGEYITLESHDIELDQYYGVGGSDFWGNTLYIGIGGPYEMFKMSMTDYSIQRITKHYYNDDGTEMSGSTQGVHVDSRHLWVFSNIAGSSNNYLIVYNR